MKKKSGIQIDSLCDAICFGVLPSVIGYDVGMNSWADVPVLIMFRLCEVIRLAYFNVAEEERQKKTSDVRKVYEGLPVTSVSLILPFLYSFRRDIGYENFRIVYEIFLFFIAVALYQQNKSQKTRNENHARLCRRRCSRTYMADLQS